VYALLLRQLFSSWSLTAIGGRKISGAFDTVWPSATKMGTGLTMPSVLHLATQHTAKQPQSKQQKLTIP
jgi:hypothetical protein